MELETECNQHGAIKITPDDVLVGFTVYLVHCPTEDHLFMRGLTPRTEDVLTALGCERLGS